MRQFSGFEEKRQAGRETLPAGGYVARILNAEVVNTDYGERLVLSFDIAEGDYRGFFEEDWKNNDREDKKWRGVYRMGIPKGDGSKEDGWAKSTFNHVMWALAESNRGYHWDWDESKLKGKVVGVLFRNKEWEYEGKSGWTTECCRLDSADKIREGDYTTPRDKPLQNKAPAGYVASTGVSTNFNSGFGTPGYMEALAQADGELPF